jgi:hypothetical protein
MYSLKHSTHTSISRLGEEVREPKIPSGLHPLCIPNGGVVAVVDSGEK